MYFFLAYTNTQSKNFIQLDCINFRNWLLHLTFKPPFYEIYPDAWPSLYDISLIFVIHMLHTFYNLYNIRACCLKQITLSCLFYAHVPINKEMTLIVGISFRVALQWLISLYDILADTTRASVECICVLYYRTIKWTSFNDISLIFYRHSFLITAHAYTHLYELNKESCVVT